VQLVAGGRANGHHSRAVKNNIWITEAEPFLGYEDEADSDDGVDNDGFDKPELEKLEDKIRLRNAWEPTNDATTRVTEEKTFTSVEPFDLNDEDDDDDNVGRKQKIAMFLYTPQLNSEDSDTTFPGTVAERPFNILDQSVTTGQLATEAKVETKTNDTLSGHKHVPDVHNWTTDHKRSDQGKHTLHVEHLYGGLQSFRF